MTKHAITEKKLRGYRWRSSSHFITFTIGIALYTEALLYGFIVPILPYMLEHRLHLDPSKTQDYTSKLLTAYGLVQLISAPITAHISDKLSRRKAQLLIALGLGIVGTGLVAIWAIYFGAVLQAIAASTAWIVGFATLMDTAGPDRQGTATGVALSFSSAGMISGPAISGVLLRLVGYWPTWTVPIAVLAIDVIARLVMVEAKAKESASGPNFSIQDPEDSASDEERTRLLAENHTPNTPKTSITLCFWTSGVLTGLAGCVLVTALITSFENTFPLHARRTFGWDSLPTGLMFLSLQTPGVILGLPCGWVRDRFNIRYTSTVGWATLFPFMWLVGTPGNEHYPWAQATANGPAITTASLIAIGGLCTLVQGFGVTELSAAVQKWESTNPKVFGPNGAGSRVFALAETAFTLGIMLGPLVSGSLIAHVGYSTVNLILGEDSFCLLYPPVILQSISNSS
ncbi:putative MFS transporter [Leptodontidium sp. MPI-SDFR-AT-0119]|nr:putative MFS transporter [Leptodontidium sp. MPI-SDFR-AT-0119]